MSEKKALFLIDGIHKADNTVSAVRELCGRHNADPGAFLWIGGTEKMKDRESFSGVFEKAFGFPVSFHPVNPGYADISNSIHALLENAPEINTVIQLSGAPQINRHKSSKYAAAAVALGAEYIAGETVFRAYRVDTAAGKPSIGIYATDKRVGKTAFGSYIGSLLCGIRGKGGEYSPVIITHSRGGPDDPPLIDIYRKSSGKPPAELTKKELLTSRFKPEYLGRLLDFGLHGASDVFEDALIISAYLDAWEDGGREAPYISLIGCRRAGAAYFNEFAVSNVDKGIRAANLTPADIIVHEGSGAEHPPVEVNAVVFLVPSDAEAGLLEDFPGLEKAPLFIFANCQHETSTPENPDRIIKAIKTRRPDASFRYTRFEPEIIGSGPGGLSGRKAAFFTTAPGYIIDTLSRRIENMYGCGVVAAFNNLDNDAAMRDSIKEVSGKCDIMLFEIKARGVEGAIYAKERYGSEYLYVNNIPVEVDRNFNPLGSNDGLDGAITETAHAAASLFSERKASSPV